MKRTQDNRNRLYPGTAYDEYRELLREHLGEAEAARIAAEQEQKPLSAGIRAGMRKVALAQEKARARAGLRPKPRLTAKRPAGIVWTERIVCLGDTGRCGPAVQGLVYEDVVRRHAAFVAATAGREKRQAAYVRLTWPDGRSVVFRGTDAMRRATGVSTNREHLLHGKRLRGFTVEFGTAADGKQTT